MTDVGNIELRGQEPEDLHSHHLEIIFIKITFFSVSDFYSLCVEEEETVCILVSM